MRKSLTTSTLLSIWSPEVEDSVDKLSVRDERRVKAGEAGKEGKACILP